jgi:hypothetical protein
MSDGVPISKLKSDSRSSRSKTKMIPVRTRKVSKKERMISDLSLYSNDNYVTGKQNRIKQLAAYNRSCQ